MSSIDIDCRVKDLPPLIARFLRNPVGAMKTSVRLSWPAIFLLQSGGAALSGAIAAAISRSLIDFAVALVIFPIIAVMACSVFTLFLYYFFAGFASVFLEMRRLNSLTVIATIPFFVIHAFSGFLAPLDLIGFALSMILLTVGLVEQFGLARRLVFTVLASIFGSFFAVWSIVQFVRG